MLFRANNRSGVLSRIYPVGVQLDRAALVRGLTMADDEYPYLAPELRPKYLIGLDLGQVSDFTALAVLKATPQRSHGGIVNNYDCMHLHRYPLGTSYPAIAAHVAGLAGRAELRPLYPGRLRPNRGIPIEQGPPPVLAIDSTGVGVAVTDIFTALWPPIPAIVRPMTITAGDNVKLAPWPTSGQMAMWIAKRALVSVCQSVLQSGRLKVVAELELADVL